MHPTLIIAVARERAAELRRSAGAERRTRADRGRPRPALRLARRLPGGSWVYGRRESS